MSTKTSIKTLEHQGVIVGVTIQQADKKVFVDRNIDSTQEEVQKLVEELMRDPTLVINNQGYAEITRGVVLQLGTIIPRNVIATPGSLKLEGKITPHGKLSHLKDDGTIGKSNWRFALLQYAQTIFKKGILGGTGVIFMPGMGKEEFNLWRGFGVNTKDMVMIEGDSEKLIELKKKYLLSGSTPSYVSSYLGNGDEVFSRELIETLGEKPVSVLSLDTESGLSTGLYKDLLGIIANIEVEGDCFFILNIVRRAGAKFSETFTGKSAASSKDIIDDCLSAFPQRLVQESERDDLEVVHTKTGKYLGGSATPMHYVFCHIRRKRGI